MTWVGKVAREQAKPTPPVRVGDGQRVACHCGDMTDPTAEELTHKLSKAGLALPVAVSVGAAYRMANSAICRPDNHSITSADNELHLQRENEYTTLMVSSFDTMVSVTCPTHRENKIPMACVFSLLTSMGCVEMMFEKIREAANA